MGLITNRKEDKLVEDLLKIENIKTDFRNSDKSEIRVLDGVSIQLKRGEIIGLVGESGSGKSMSAMAIAGLLSRHDMTKEGKCLFQGVDTLRCSRQELRKLQGNEMGIIFQEPMTSLNPLKKIGWQVEESLRLHTDLGKAERKERALQALAEAELPNPERVYSLYPHNLSGGMRQRVMIAAAMIARPKLLIADEPTTALDVTIQAQIVKLLQKFSREKGMAVLFISHDLSLVRQLCGRVLVMQKGYVVEQGDMETVFEHPVHPYTQKLLAAIPKIPGQGGV